MFRRVSPDLEVLDPIRKVAPEVNLISEFGSLACNVSVLHLQPRLVPVLLSQVF